MRLVCSLDVVCPLGKTLVKNRAERLTRHSLGEGRRKIAYSDNLKGAAVDGDRRSVMEGMFIRRDKHEWCLFKINFVREIFGESGILGCLALQKECASPLLINIYCWRLDEIVNCVEPRKFNELWLN